MIDLDMKRLVNKQFVKKAEECAPKLRQFSCKPQNLVKISDNEGKAVPEKTAEAKVMASFPLGKGESLCLDFGNHYVGFVTLRLSSVGSPQDAPAYIRLKFAETAREILENSEDYDGWISRGWIQEEFIHIDVLPAVLTLPRRYAFRYLEILAVDTSKKWKLVAEEAELKAVSAVEVDSAEVIPTQEELLQKIDKAGLRTLGNCMQSVFEDGPKRDRRLWLGDLRLQALTNYETFRDFGLVKRCLYLFAGLTREDGRIGACLFTEPDYIVDDTFFFDYSLFFIPVLYDYYMASGDRETLEELWPGAYRQIEIAQKEFDSRGLIREMNSNDCFLDWKAGLDKQAGAQAVYIYCARRAAMLGEILGKTEETAILKEEIKAKTHAAQEYLWAPSEKMFVSGQNRQISWASQVWMILAQVVQGQEARELLLRLDREKPEMDMVTPYMNHHYVEALILCSLNDKALDYVKYYWGGMIQEGADTFWELYNPQNPQESPYGSSIVNSYCHAWSCTPSYLLRKLMKGM